MAATETPNYLDPKILERIKRLDVRARHVVEGFITGAHRSPYNGFAIEFAGHREYSPGDELKHIDWNVWAKTDRLYIKEYEEETNLKSTVIVDCSKSMSYKGHGWRKFDYAATIAAVLTQLLQRQQDSVGLVTFDTKVRMNLPPSSRPNHLKQMVEVLENTELDDKTDVGDVFLELAQQIRQRGMVILISDFFTDIDQLRESLQQFRLRRHEVILFHVMDDDEISFPFEDHTRFIGLESVDEVHADPRALRKSYLKIVNEFMAKTRKLCDGLGVDYKLINTSEPLDAALTSYLAFRKKHTRKGRAR
ncbi:MAG: hypothetical protein ACI8XO_001654 [Verrucomicrobiales bacterium]|jgi:uncharacterized protein (DUF58 family)